MCPTTPSVAAGDVIALWDEAGLIGVSVIEFIKQASGTKDIGRCPRCGGTSFEARKTMSPTYRCYNTACGELFDDPTLETVEVITYRSNHAESWIDLEGILDGPTLRSLCVSPKNQNSFRPLRVNDFRQAISAKTPGDVLHIVDSVSNQIAGGHKTQVVRVRLGQAAFRSKLLAEYKEVCAFSGPVPAAALDACHLYRYADVGVHEDQGGLLLRKDLHHLFDAGLITVDPNGRLALHAKIASFPAYAPLHQSVIQVSPTNKQRRWLAEHRAFWSPPRP